MYSVEVRDAQGEPLVPHAPADGLHALSPQALESSSSAHTFVIPPGLEDGYYTAIAMVSSRSEEDAATGSSTLYFRITDRQFEEVDPEIWLLESGALVASLALEEPGPSELGAGEDGRTP